MVVCYGKNNKCKNIFFGKDIQISMLLHKTPLMSIFFGDKREQFIPAHFANQYDSAQVLQHIPFKQLQKIMRLQHLFFLHQIHSAQGLCIVNQEQIKGVSCFSQDGDFIITALSGIGLGVATADCLPIILYDSFNQVIAIIHAGWRGTVARVVITAFERMQTLYSTTANTVSVFFGPSAKACCYVIKEDLLHALESFSYGNHVVQKHGNNYTLDVPLLNQLQLEEIGIKKDAFHLTYNSCTICDHSFCSYRRGQQLERQMSIVVLTI